MAIGYAKLPEYRIDNAMVNFDPLNKGIDAIVAGEKQGYDRTNAKNFGNAMASGDTEGAMRSGALMDPKLAMAAGQYKMSEGTFKNQQESHETEMKQKTAALLGGQMQTFKDMKDPVERDAAISKWFSSHDTDPKFANDLRRLGVADWRANPNQAVDVIHSMALGAQDEGKKRHEAAQTYKAEQEGRLAAAQADLGSKTTNAQDYAFYANQEQKGGRAPKTFSEWDLERKRASATAISIDQKGEAKFSQEVGSHQAKRFDEYVKGGTQAQQMVADLSALRDIGSRIRTGKVAEVIAALGPYADALNMKVDGLDDLQAYQAIVSRLAPQMRVPGSGATSDFEMRTFLQGLPNYGRTPAGNEMVDKTLSAMQAHRIALAEVGSRAMAHEITPAQAEREVRNLPDPFSLWRQYTKQNPTSVSPQPQPQPGQPPPPAQGQPPPAGQPTSGGIPEGQPGSRSSPVYPPNPDAASQLPPGVWFMTPEGQLRQRK